MSEPATSPVSVEVATGVRFAAAVTAVVALLALALTPTAASADACANPIACENLLAGTDAEEWKIDGAGDPTIQGFATDISVDSGDRIDFKIDTDADAYSIGIYRAGWYDGDRARLVETIEPDAALPQHQPECLSDHVTELFDCGDWEVSASWDVPSTAVSGVYFAVPERADTGGRSHILFVVRDDSSHSDIVVKTSDATWQAYNPYGGSDFYEGAGNGRAHKISYNRPVTTRASGFSGGAGRDFFWNAEYPFVAFAERNGYDLSYTTDVDTARRGDLIRNHRVFVSVGHDEYWSGEARANVEEARDAGVNLAFLGGNDVYWRARYENSADASSTSYRTLTSYKETWANDKIDPSSEWTGTFRDPRFASAAQGGASPENALVGTMFTSNRSDLAITVSAEEGKSRLWRGTSLAAQPSGTSTPLAAHTIGYESNEDLDNGHRPAGLIRLSTTTGPSPARLTDFGSTTYDSTSTHHLTLYRAASGALVFSAGSIQWSWGLDANHDGDDVPDADQRMQQAQVNLFADMDAQPASLQSDLVPATPSGDDAGPSTLITAPTANATVANGSVVTLTGTAEDIGGVVAGVEVSADGGSTWHPATGTTAWSYDLIAHGMGDVEVLVRAIDDSANPGAPARLTLHHSGPYSVFGAEQPDVETSPPASVDSQDGGAYELGLRFAPTVDGHVTGVRFFKSAANTGSHTGSLWSANGVRLATGTFHAETDSGWQTLEFTTPVPVDAGTTYTVSYSTEAGHYASDAWAFAEAPVTRGPLNVDGGLDAAPAGVFGAPGSYPASSWQNTNYFVDVTFSTTVETPLTAISRWPRPASSSVDRETIIEATLSTAVATATVTVRDQNGASIDGTTSVDGRTVTFTPTSALAAFVSYEVSIAATSPTGAVLGADGTWSFRTMKPEPETGACPCGLFSDSTVPTVLEVSEATPVTLGIAFTPSTDGSVTGVSFYKSAGNTGTHTGSLWGPGGTRLATATFTDETTSGWQTVTFVEPVAVDAGTEYTASYRSTAGGWSVTPGQFVESGLTTGPLAAGPNAGAFSYDDGYPGGRISSNYLVDVVFQKAPAPIAVLGSTPANDATAVVPSADLQVELSSAIADGFTFSATTDSGPIAGSTSVSADRRTVTFHPSAGLPAGATVEASLRDIHSAEGATAADFSWTFAVAGSQPTAYTFFGDEVPAVASEASDGASVELGMAFQSSEAGRVTAIRFFKGPDNTGTHTGSVWSAAGQRLASVTFADETATGWQTAQLGSPLTIEAGATYLVSYLAPRGNYAHTGGYFAASASSGPLTAPAGDNGRYVYGAGGAAPAYSWNSTNYFVDVVFEAGSGSSSPAELPPLDSISLFGNQTPVVEPGNGEGASVELGTAFESSVAGEVTAIRFYKAVGNIGAHVGSLWSSTGERLATVAFTDETIRGWQTATLDAPVSIEPGRAYVVSYYAPLGGYSYTTNYFGFAATAGPLTAPAGMNGRYRYGGGGSMPTDSWGATNYFVDVVFRPVG